MGFTIARIIAVILLFWALDRHPYSYYKLLRFVVCGVTAYGAYFAIKIRKIGWAWILGTIAVLFNPIIPVHLDRSTWSIIDLVVAILLLLSLFLLQHPESTSDTISEREAAKQDKRRWKIWGIISFSIFSLIVIIGIIASSRYQEVKQLPTGTVRVIKVNDGDTISVILNGKRQKIRLIGIDAPELGQRPWGHRAKKHLRDIISDSKWKISLEFDIEKRDKHGRLLSYIWTHNGRMLNTQMVEDGYAMLYTIPPNVKYVDELKKAQYEARAKKQGIWSSTGLKKTPQEYRREHPRL